MENYLIALISLILTASSIIWYWLKTTSSSKNNRNNRSNDTEQIFSSTNCLITGGSSGLGKAIAMYLATEQPFSRNGQRNDAYFGRPRAIVLAARGKEGLLEAIDDIKKEQEKVESKDDKKVSLLSQCMDVCREESVNEAIKQCIQQLQDTNTEESRRAQEDSKRLTENKSQNTEESRRAQGDKHQQSHGNHVQTIDRHSSNESLTDTLVQSKAYLDVIFCCAGACKPGLFAHQHQKINEHGCN